MNLQVIKSVEGKAEYVLLPIGIYEALKNQIDKNLKNLSYDEYVVFEPSDYINNPVLLARITAGMTQEMLAKRMKVTQAYISKIENQDKVSAKLMHKIKLALNNK